MRFVFLTLNNVLISIFFYIKEEFNKDTKTYTILVNTYLPLYQTKVLKLW